MAQDGRKPIYITQHHSGNGRGLSTGKLLPKSWRILRVTILEETSDVIVLKLEPVAKED